MKTFLRRITARIAQPFVRYEGFCDRAKGLHNHARLYRCRVTGQAYLQPFESKRLVPIENLDALHQAGLISSHRRDQGEPLKIRSYQVPMLQVLAKESALST